MSNKLLLLLSISVVAMSGLSACCTAMQPLSTKQEASSAKLEASEVKPEASAPVIEQPTTATASNHNSIYFEFDKYDVKPEYNNLIHTNSDYLAAHNAASVQIQGNTDDIGSVEYNLALGQKRADAVKKALIGAGANGNAIEATSNGKLQPKYSEDKQNRRGDRRADIIYTQVAPNGYELNNKNLPIVNNNFYNGEPVVEGVIDQRFDE